MQKKSKNYFFYCFKLKERWIESPLKKAQSQAPSKLRLRYACFLSIKFKIKDDFPLRANIGYYLREGREKKGRGGKKKI